MNSSQQALQLAESGADRLAWRAAEYHLIELARNGRPFTSDALLDYLDEHNHYRGSAKWLGSLIKTYERQGVVKHTGQYWPSYRKECHRRPKAVWVGINTV